MESSNPPPNEKHASWLYVSSGLSNAWEDDSPNPQGMSGLGCEFMFETTKQGRWAITCVQNLIAYQILLACGRFERKELVGYHHRIPLGGPLASKSVLTSLTITLPEGYPSTIATPSGHVDLLALVGISAEEAQFAREHGGDALVAELKEANAFPVTNPARPSTRPRAGAV
jgi:hypothetical protein